MTLNQWWKNLAYNQGGSPLKLAAPVLIPLSFVYGGIARFRRAFFEAGLLRGRRFDIPVLSVGNITVGGVGKTPFTIYLAKRLEANGFSTAILTRGYKRQSKEAIILTEETLIPKQIAQYGDEAALITWTSGLPVCISSNRARIASQFLEKYECDVFLLDDGFQHLAVQRDTDIILADAEQPLGNGFTLPYGPLREPPQALGKASAMILNGTKSDSTPIKHLSPDCPIFQGLLTWQNIQPFTDWSKRADTNLCPVEDFSDQDVVMLSGVGNPTRLQKQAEANGFRVTHHQAYEDHYWFSAEEVNRVHQQYPDLPILMTEKDAIRLTPLIHQLHDSLTWIFVIRAEWVMQDQSAFDEWLGNQLQSILQNKQQIED